MKLAYSVVFAVLTPFYTHAFLLLPPPHQWSLHLVPHEVWVAHKAVSGGPHAACQQCSCLHRQSGHQWGLLMLPSHCQSWCPLFTVFLSTMEINLLSGLWLIIIVFFQSNLDNKKEYLNNYTMPTGTCELCMNITQSQTQVYQKKKIMNISNWTHLRLKNLFWLGSRKFNLTSSKKFTNF